MGKRLKGFNVGKTGYSVSNLRRETVRDKRTKKKRDIYYYHFNLNSPDGGSWKATRSAKKLEHLKNKLINEFGKKKK